MLVAGSHEDRDAAGGYLLHQGLIAKRPFRLAKDDNRDSHRVETEELRPNSDCVAWSRPPDVDLSRVKTQ